MKTTGMESIKGHRGIGAAFYHCGVDFIVVARDIESLRTLQEGLGWKDLVEEKCKRCVVLPDAPADAEKGKL